MKHSHKLTKGFRYNAIQRKWTHEFANKYFATLHLKGKKVTNLPTRISLQCSSIKRTHELTKRDFATVQIKRNELTSLLTRTCAASKFKWIEFEDFHLQRRRLLLLSSKKKIQTLSNEDISAAQVIGNKLICLHTSILLPFIEKKTSS